MNVLEKILEEIKDNARLGSMHLENIRIEKVEEIIRSHMDEAENDGWISVSKRLPEENGYYLITVKKLNYEEHVTISFFDKYDMRGWQHVHMLTEKVTAWKPLPEPYKGE